MSELGQLHQLDMALRGADMDWFEFAKYVFACGMTAFILFMLLTSFIERHLSNEEKYGRLLEMTWWVISKAIMVFGILAAAFGAWWIYNL